MKGRTGEHPAEVSLLAPRAIYICVWGAVAALSLCDILGVFGGCCFAPTARQKYAADMLCVLLTLGGSWGALRLFAMQKVRESLRRVPSSLRRWNFVRTALLGVPVLLNLTLALFTAGSGGYGALGGSTQVYCLLVALIAFVFCWPKHGEGETD